LPLVDIPIGGSQSFLVNHTITDKDFEQPSITNIAYAVIRVNKCNVVNTLPTSTTITQPETEAEPDSLVAILKYDGSNSIVKVSGVSSGVTAGNINITPTQGNTISITNGIVTTTITGTPNEMITINVFPYTITVSLITSGTTITLIASGIPKFLIDPSSITLNGGTITNITIKATIPIVINHVNATLTIPYF